jgi:hypothetical protein
MEEDSVGDEDCGSSQESHGFEGVMDCGLDSDGKHKGMVFP